MPENIVILQSNYIPWKGYFDLLQASDLFVIYDEVQFTRRDWRNRNKIILNGKPTWLTIPVDSKGQYFQSIKDVKVSNNSWAHKHWTSIKHAYAKAPYFKDYEALLSQCYAEAASMEFLSQINRLFLTRLAPLLGIEADFRTSSEVPQSADNPVDRLIEICQAFDGKTYISGPAAKSYMVPERFEQAGIGLVYADYSGYPSYPQASDCFEHGVSLIDLLMHAHYREFQ